MQVKEGAKMQVKEHRFNAKDLLARAKLCNDLTPEREERLHRLRDRMTPFISEIVQESYARLREASLLRDLTVDQEVSEEEMIRLIQAIFIKPLDEATVKEIYALGRKQMEQNFPIEVVSGLIFIVSRQLVDRLFRFCDDPKVLKEDIEAVLAVIGFKLQILQRAFLDRELEMFCKITGMSPKLIEQLSRV